MKKINKKNKKIIYVVIGIVALIFAVYLFSHNTNTASVLYKPTTGSTLPNIGMASGGGSSNPYPIHMSTDACSLKLQNCP